MAQPSGYIFWLAVCEGSRNSILQLYQARPNLYLLYSWEHCHPVAEPAPHMLPPASAGSLSPETRACWEDSQAWKAWDSAVEMMGFPWDVFLITFSKSIVVFMGLLGIF